MFDWGPYSFAGLLGLMVAGAALAAAVMELRRWRRSPPPDEPLAPETQFRVVVETFNRLDQSLSADSLGGMPTRGGRRR